MTNVSPTWRKPLAYIGRVFEYCGVRPIARKYSKFEEYRSMILNGN